MSASLKGLLHSSQPTERATWVVHRCTCLYSYFAPRVFEFSTLATSVLYSTVRSLHHSRRLHSSQLLFETTSTDACVCVRVCVPVEYLRGEAAVLSRSTRAGRPLPESWGPSDKRDEERGVVTLGAGAGRCPGPAAAEVEPRLLRTNGACERASACAMGSSLRSLLKAVCLRY